jgi:hypothetical protein
MHQDLAALQLVEAQTLAPTVEALEEEDVVWQVSHGKEKEGDYINNSLAPLVRLGMAGGRGDYRHYFGPRIFQTIATTPTGPRSRGGPVCQVSDVLLFLFFKSDPSAACLPDMCR